MSKSVFANLIIDRINDAIGTDGSAYNQDCASRCQEAMSKAITEYIVKNTKVKVAYNGTLTSNGSTDPVINDEFNVTGQCKTITTPTSFPEWVKSIQSAIAQGFEVANMGTNGVCANFKPFNPISNVLNIHQGILKDIHEQSNQNPQHAIWEQICKNILDWINSEQGQNMEVRNIPATIPGKSVGEVSLISISIL